MAKDDNTARMLQTELDVCAEAGHQTGLSQAGGCSVRCMACGGCNNHLGRCVIDDLIKD